MDYYWQLILNTRPSPLPSNHPCILPYKAITLQRPLVVRPDISIFQYKKMVKNVIRCATGNTLCNIACVQCKSTYLMGTSTVLLYMWAEWCAGVQWYSVYTGSARVSFKETRLVGLPHERAGVRECKKLSPPVSARSCRANVCWAERKGCAATGGWA